MLELFLQCEIQCRLNKCFFKYIKVKTAKLIDKNIGKSYFDFIFQNTDSFKTVNPIELEKIQSLKVYQISNGHM